MFAEMVDFICHAGGQRFAAPKRPPRQLEHSREYLVPGEQAAIRIKCRDPLAHAVERCLQHAFRECRSAICPGKKKCAGDKCAGRDDASYQEG